jgi:dihydrofolate reductase
MKQADVMNTTIISDQLADNIHAIKQSGHGEEILLFGSPTATHALMELDLIDGYWLFVNPVILGEGIPLFPGINRQTKLNLLTSRQFTNGVTELSYVVKGSNQ